MEVFKRFFYNLSNARSSVEPVYGIRVDYHYSVKLNIPQDPAFSTGRGSILKYKSF